MDGVRFMKVIDSTAQKPDYVLLATVGALVALGLVMVYSASFVEAFTLYETQFFYVSRQSIGALIGTIAMLGAMQIHYTVWRRFSVHFMGVAIVLLVLVLVLPESMTMVNSSRSWIRWQGGLISIQPSEMAKLAIIIYFADWLSRRGASEGGRAPLHHVTYGLIPFGVMLGIVCGLVALEPDLGTTFTILVIAGAIYFAAGANLWHLAGALGLGAGAFWVMVEVIGIRNGRILAFQDPWQYYDSYGYQPIHALYGFASGGIVGEGLGQARQKFQWLPQAHTDAILAIVGEELGLIGTMLVVIGFAIIAYRGYRIALRAPDPFASLVAVGITSWIVFQGLINMAVITSLVPFTGLTLPFLSYGNTSLIMCMLSVGVLLNISRHMHNKPRRESSHEKTVLRSPVLQHRRDASRRGSRRPATAWQARVVWETIDPVRRRDGRTRLPSAVRARSTAPTNISALPRRMVTRRKRSQARIRQAPSALQHPSKAQS